MPYVWDEEKNRTIKAKHGIRFETATKAFDDPFIVSRYHVIALVDGVTILFVVFTDRKVGLGETVTRIISARRAEPAERRIYEEERRANGGF